MSPSTRRGVCLVLAAPSGAGKSTIARALLDTDPNVRLSVSVTTRPPRDGEIDGVHYFFRDQATFNALVAEGALLEWAHVFGRSYGTPRAPVEQALAAGQDVLFDIDWQGYRHLRAAMPDDVLGVYLLPPSLAELEARLARRGDAPADIVRRMQTAREELAHAGEFAHVVVNTDLPHATATVRAILEAARTATARQAWLAGYLSGLSC